MRRPVNLVSKLDAIFSKYIKKKHSKNGYCRCVTCNKLIELGSADLQAGHFIKRQIWSLRWNEYNVHPQCVRCNMYLSGNLANYSEYIIKSYGLNKFNEILTISKKVKKKPTENDLKLLIEIYQKKLLA